MQILENSVLALRAAVIEMRRDGEAPSFTLYPMVHIGEQRFYEEVWREIGQHDLLICEGVRSRKARWLAQSYVQAARHRGGELVLQHKVLNARTIAVPFRLADLPGRAFDQLWAARIPFVYRLLLPLAAVGFGLLWRFYGGAFAMRKMKSLDSFRMSEEDDWLDAVVLDSRDAVLIAALDKAIEEGPRRVAVLYGAGHMPAVIHHLMRRCRYRVAQARWFTIVAY